MTVQRYGFFLKLPYFFSVILPNRSIASSAQIEIDLESSGDKAEKTQLTEEKTQFSGRKTQLETEKAQLTTPNLNSEFEEPDWELKYFETTLRRKAATAFRSKSIQNILALFQRYRYRYSFNRRNIAELFCISENAASRIINKCLEMQIIRKIRIDEYQFVSD